MGGTAGAVVSMLIIRRPKRTRMLSAIEEDGNGDGDGDGRSSMTVSVCSCGSDGDHIRGEGTRTSSSVTVPFVALASICCMCAELPSSHDRLNRNRNCDSALMASPSTILCLYQLKPIRRKGV